MTERLCEATVNRIPAWVQRPEYDRSRLRPGVIHIGIGAFHRAHQAPVFDAVAAAGDLGWGVQAASLRSSSVRDRLTPQEGYYCLVERDQEEQRVRLVGSLLDVIVAPERPSALVAALAAPTTHIVTLTVTEKGYLPDARDQPGRPHSAAAYVAEALAERRARGLSSLTIISCDNLPDNGDKLRTGVLRLCDEPMREWIERRTSFPRTMFDRIVPQTEPEDINQLASSIGLIDRAMVKTEPYWQWVIEDRFAGERPDFERTGVQIVANVSPWEAAKLRLLNGAHSAMAYLGGLAGLTMVDGFVSAPAGRALVERLWDEVAPTLKPADGLDIPAYRRALMKRFGNRALGHRLAQIAADGSQKLPQRLLAPLAEQLARGLPVGTIVLAIAAWMRWQEGRTDAGEHFVVDDPFAARISGLLERLTTADDKVQAMLSVGEIFPVSIVSDNRFVELLVQQFAELGQFGALPALARLNAEAGSFEKRS